MLVLKELLITLRYQEIRLFFLLFWQCQLYFQTVGGNYQDYLQNFTCKICKYPKFSYNVLSDFILFVSFFSFISLSLSLSISMSKFENFNGISNIITYRKRYLRNRNISLRNGLCCRGQICPFGFAGLFCHTPDNNLRQQHLKSSNVITM